MDADPYEVNPSGNLLKGIDLGRVAEAVKTDRRATEVFRSNRLAFVREHVGSYYGEGGLTYEVPLPLISTFLSTYSRALVAKEPRVNLSTFDKRMAPAVDAMQSWQNDWFEEIELGDILRRSVYDALLSEARVKVCLTAPELAEAAYGSEAGQPGIYLIDEDDWVCDMRARNEREWSYCGHRYRIPLEVARDIFRKKWLSRSDPSDHGEDGIEKLFTVGSGFRANKDEIEDYIDLWEIHVKGRFDVVLTLLDEDGYPAATKKGLLRVQKYLGPKGGNIFSLGYGTVPGNLRPVSPIMQLMPLHLAVNRSYRKLIDTADNFKVILPVRGGSMSSEGKAIQSAKHMELVACDNPGDVQEVAFNRPSPELQLFCTDMRNAFNFFGGGLATLGGRDVSAPTATQEKIVNANANANVGDLQGSTIAFVSRAIRCLNWYLWNHPENVYTTQKLIPGTQNEYLKRQLHPANDELPSYQDLVDSHELMRSGPMPRIKVDPFSLQHLSPAEKDQFISQTIQEFAPFASIMASQGVTLDVAAALKLKARYRDEPDLLKVFKDQGPPAPPSEGGDESSATLDKDHAMMPAETTRNYNRISTAGGAQEQAADQQKQLMSASANGQS